MAERSVSFAIALDPEWEQVDLLTREGGRRIHGTLAAVLIRAARTDGRSQSLMARSLVARAPSGEPLAAGLHASLAPQPAAVPWTGVEDDAFGAASDVAAITLPVGDGLRVREAIVHRSSSGSEIPVLRVRYLVHTPLGLLTVSLTTFQTARTAEWERLFDAMAQTARLA